MDAQTHWEKIYTTKTPEAVSWYRPHLETSLGLIERAASGHSASIIDVGGGESTLADDLIERALRENSEKQPIGGDLSVLPFLRWLALEFRP